MNDQAYGFEWPDALTQALMPFGVAVSREVGQKFGMYGKMLCEWNERMNLTSLTDLSSVAQKHFADSLLLLATDWLPQGARVIDVGTGAGFPGVPLKLMRPDIELTLLDSLKKRLTFLSAVCDEVGVSAELIHARAEDGARDESLRERFDTVVTRAVANAATLCEYTLPYAKIGGFSIAYKGPGVHDDFTRARNAIVLLGGEPRVDFAYFDCVWGERLLARIRKSGKTSAKYPRKAPLPAKAPL